MKNIIIIGEKFQQSQKLQYILDNIENCQINYTNIEKNLIDQIQTIQKNHKNSLTNIIYEIKKSTNLEQQNVIEQLKKANKIIPKIVLVCDDEVNEEANKIKIQLQSKLNVQIYNLVDYFKQYYNYDKQIDLNDKRIAMFISKEQDVKNKIFQTVKSPAILQDKWALINTPQFNMNSDAKQKNETINEFKTIFKTYQNQISLFFIILDEERYDIVKQKFMELFPFLKKFKHQVIVLLYNRLDENFEESSTLENFFIKIAKIRKVYSVSNSQLKDQHLIYEYFNKILEEQKDDLEIGVDMKDTTFEIKDEIQSEFENQTYEQNFYKTKLQQLKQSVDQNDQQINLYKQKNDEQNQNIKELEKQINQYKQNILEYQRNIRELETSKYQLQNQIREIEREMTKKQKIIDKLQVETQNNSQNSQQEKITQLQGSQNKNKSQIIINNNDSQTLKQLIQCQDQEKREIEKQLSECFKKLDDKYLNCNTEQLNLTIISLLKKKEEIEIKIQKYTNQLDQELKKDDQNCQNTINEYNSIYTKQISNNCGQSAGGQNSRKY